MTQEENTTREILLRAMDLIAQQPICPSPMFPVVPEPLKTELARLDRIVIPRHNPELSLQETNDRQRFDLEVAEHKALRILKEGRIEYHLPLGWLNSSQQ